ncbi:transposase [Methylomonas methanica]|uniref:transposase n=1 Tax=Methylomonas methanica TaxID=421 RepID=UPI0009EDF6DF
MTNRYHHADLMKGYLVDSKIELIFLPPYAPNLNLIERFWTFFKKTVLLLYGR